LTTSMLPRLAELWKARKIMYFVGTNHIEYFDRAITRSERFDAIIFLSPPSFAKKRDEILRILREKYTIEATFAENLTEETIAASAPEDFCSKAEAQREKADRDRAKAQPLPPQNALIKFALVRWDELKDIALHLSESCNGRTKITSKILSDALQKVHDSKSRTLGEYCRFISDPKDYEWFDSSRNGSWIVVGELPGDKQKLQFPFKQRGDRLVVEAPIGSRANVKATGFSAFEGTPPESEHLLGVVRLEKQPYANVGPANAEKPSPKAGKSRKSVRPPTTPRK
jgi:hypothetical protein